jgi:hypothetical protein
MTIAARGDAEIRGDIRRQLDQFGKDPANAAFAAALREIIDGGDPPLVDGLDPAQAGVLDAIHNRLRKSKPLK